MNKGLFRAMGMQAAGAGVCAAASFLLLLFLARHLGVDAFGQYVALLSTALLGLMLIEAGWPTFVYREFASHDAQARASVMLQRAFAHLGMATAALVLLAVLATASGMLSSYALAAALACMGFVASMNLVSGRLRGEGRFGLDALWQVMGRAASALLIVAYVYRLGVSIASIFLAWAAGLALVLALAGRRWIVRPHWGELVAAYGLVVPLFAYEGLLALLTKGDMAVLGHSALTASELSFYAAASRLSEAALLLFAPVSNVLLRAFRQVPSTEAFRFLLVRVTAATFASGMLLVAASALLGDRIMPLLFGADFTGAGALLPWVAASLPLSLSNLVLLQALLACDREHALLWRLGVAAMLFAPALALGSAIDGARGAALGLLLVHLVLAVTCLPLALRGPRMRRAAICGAGMRA